MWKGSYGLSCTSRHAHPGGASDHVFEDDGFRCCKSLESGPGSLDRDEQTVARRAQVRADLDQLLDLTISPSTRNQIEQRLCLPRMELSAEQLELVLGFRSPQVAQISGARIASCRKDPALGPLMLESFLGAKFGYLPFDPDIFERLLFGLQQLPKESLAVSLEQAKYRHLLDAAWAHLLDTRLEALMTEGELQRPTFRPEQRQAAQQFLTDWLTELFDGPGLVALQADSGDRALFLLEQFEAILIAELITDAQPGVVRAAVEAARHLAHPFPEPARALRQRLATGDLSEDFRQSLELLPAADSETISPPPLGKTYPQSNIYLEPSDRRWPIKLSQPERHMKTWPATALACGLLTTLWLLGMAYLPSRRHLLKRVGAILIAPLLLAATEGALTLADVAPRMDLRPTFNPNKVPEQLWRVQELEGVDFAVTVEGRARQLAFPVAKEAGSWRVFALGESSVHGSYYPLEGSFAARLEYNLSARNPGQKVEVINAGVGAALSDGIAHYAFEALRYQPDLLVLYLGNNDMSHFVAMAGFQGLTARRIELRYLLDRVRLIRVINDLLPRDLLERFAGANKDSAYLDLEQLSHDDRAVLLKLAEANATQNIERVARRARSQGVQVLIGIQAQNQDLCPTDRFEDSSSGCFPETLRRIAVTAGARSGATVVDIPAALRHHAGGQLTGIAGEDYFYDTVHPSLLGHAVIARTITPAAEDLLLNRAGP